MLKVRATVVKPINTTIDHLLPGDVFCFPGVDRAPKLSEPHLRLGDKFVRLFGDFAVFVLDNRYASYDVYRLHAQLEVSL